MASFLARWPRHASALTLTCLLGAAGCSDTATPSLLAPSEFPGSPVTNSYLADDKLAFSDSGAVSSIGDVKVFRNVANEDAILIYQSANNTGAGNRRLFASYYNGSTLTPPVEILGAGERPTQNRSSIKVLFLNTGSFSGADGTATANARGRNGDALIVYVGRDSDDVSSAQADDRDSNDRVYATYFDKSAAGAAATGTIVHGFERVAQPIDFDHVLTGPGNDPDAIAAGFVSDSLHGTHGFGQNAGSVTLSGDPTSFVQLLVYKSPSAGTTNVERRWFAIPFDLGQVGNAFVAQAGATSGLLNPAAGAGTLEDGDPMINSVVVADGLVASQADNVDVNGQDRVVTATVFSQSASTASILLGSTPTADQDRTELPRVGDVYGPDHGVGGYYAFFTETGFSDGNDGSRAADRDLLVAQIDVGGTTRVVREIDAYTTTISNADADMDGQVVHDGDSGAVASGQYGTRLHRDGDLISVYMMQPNTDLSDLDDADPNVDRPERNNLPYLQVVQTGRPATDADLTSSVLAAPLLAPAIPSTGDVNNGIQQISAGNFAFQIGVPDATAADLGGPNLPTDAWQKNPNRIYFRYTQYNDQNAGGNVPNEVRLFTAGLEVTPGANAGTAPTATLLRNSISAALVQFPGGASPLSGSDDNWNNVGAPFSAQVVDRGTTAGEFLTFFVSNDNNVPDSGANGAYQAARLYVWDGTTTQLVSSAGQSDWQTAARAPTITMAGNRIHLVWGEHSSTPSSELSVVSRSLATGTAQVTATPALTEAPAQLDLDSNGGIGNISVAVSGATVGVYIQEGGHVYYNQTTTDAAHYRAASGLPNPTLVDNESADDLQGWTVWNGDGLSPLRHSFFVYQKSIVNTGVTDQRLFIRIHD